MRTACHFERAWRVEAAGKSGAETTALQTLARSTGRLVAREAFGVRSLQRRFPTRETARSVKKTLNSQLSTLNPRSALTLLEMMISMTLLAVIMVGLLAMFSHTQKALHIASTQTDVFENARGAIQLVSRDLSELSAHDDPQITSGSFLLVTNTASPLQLPGVGGATVLQAIFFEEAVWLTKVNNQWEGRGYYVENTNFGVGTLYRYSETTNHAAAASLINRFYNPDVVTHRVSDGIVHFQLTPVYPDIVITATSTNYIFVAASTFNFSNVLPAFVDIDLGVLEPGTLKQFESLTGNVAVAQRFLADHVGKIHFFRERVPIRNFINPYRANEVP